MIPYITVLYVCAVHIIIHTYSIVFIFVCTCTNMYKNDTDKCYFYLDAMCTIVLFIRITYTSPHGCSPIMSALVVYCDC